MYEDFELKDSAIPASIKLEDLMTFQEKREIILIKCYGVNVAILDYTYGWWKIENRNDPEKLIKELGINNVMFRANRSTWVNGLNVVEVNSIYVETEGYNIPINTKYTDKATASDLDMFCDYVKTVDENH